MTQFSGKALRSTPDLSVEGEVLVTDTPITLLGFVDAKTGEIVEKDHPLYGESVTGKVFVFPKGIGSTVGPYVLINLKKFGKEPLLVINRESDQGTIAGCSVAKIPLVYNCSIDPISSLESGERVKIIINNQQATITTLPK